MHDEWKIVSQKCGYGWPEKEMNNGMLYLRGSFAEEYKAAVQKASGVSDSGRVLGTFAFNIMLQDNPTLWAEASYDNSVIWWDSDKWLDAKSIQYCNDQGQSKRLRLEALYDATH